MKAPHPDLHRIARPPARAGTGHGLRPRGLVFAADMADAVRFAGGWLVDRALAGWEILVLTGDHGNSRPLRILGAHGVDLQCALSSPIQDPWPPKAIVAGAELYASDARVRRVVLRALQDGPVDVRLWDQWELAVPEEGTLQVPHRLSTAARLFKAQAMVAAAVPPCDTGEEVTEAFRGLGVRQAGRG